MCSRLATLAAGLLLAPLTALADPSATAEAPVRASDYVLIRAELEGCDAFPGVLKLHPLGNGASRQEYLLVRDEVLASMQFLAEGGECGIGREPRNDPQRLEWEWFPVSDSPPSPLQRTRTASVWSPSDDS